MLSRVACRTHLELLYLKILAFVANSTFLAVAIFYSVSDSPSTFDRFSMLVCRMLRVRKLTRCLLCWLPMCTLSAVLLILVHVKPLTLDRRANYALYDARGRYQQTEVTWSPKKILLFTYARSGSSFTGDIIHHSPDVYYVFEPLKTLHDRLARKPNSSMAPKEALLQALLSCRFNATVVTNITQWFLRRDNDTLPLLRCVGQKNHTQRAVCLKTAESVCHKHNKVFLKTIRCPAPSVPRLMDTNPDLALIFLVRDPRGSIWSQIAEFMSPKQSELPWFARQYCDLVANDTSVMIDVFHKYPQRVRFLRYEDLAMRPVEVSRNIYRFLHLTWNEGIQLAVINQTHPDDIVQAAAQQNQVQQGPPLMYAFTITREDSYAAANRWRHCIPWQVTSTIQKGCADLMELLGYHAFPSLVQVRALAVPNRRGFRLIGTLNTSGESADLGDAHLH